MTHAFPYFVINSPRPGINIPNNPGYLLREAIGRIGACRAIREILPFHTGGTSSDSRADAADSVATDADNAAPFFTPIAVLQDPRPVLLVTLYSPSRNRECAVDEVSEPTNHRTPSTPRTPPPNRPITPSSCASRSSSSRSTTRLESCLIHNTYIIQASSAAKAST